MVSYDEGDSYAYHQLCLMFSSCWRSSTPCNCQYCRDVVYKGLRGPSQETNTRTRSESLILPSTPSHIPSTDKYPHYTTIPPKKPTVYKQALRMTPTYRLLLGAASLLWAAQTASAAPHPSNSLARALFKRDDVTFEDCGGDKDDKRKKAGQAWSEAANLASFTIAGKLDDGTEFKDTNA